MRGRGGRILLGGLALVVALYLTLIARGVSGFGALVGVLGGRERDGCADCVGTRPAAGVVRGERAVAWIRRMAPPRPPERPLPLYLAHGRKGAFLK